MAGGPAVHVNSLQSNQTAENGAYLTMREVSLLVRKTQRTVAEWMKRGNLPYFKIGRSILFSRQDIDSFLREKFRIVGPAPVTARIKFRSRGRKCPSVSNS